MFPELNKLFSWLPPLPLDIIFKRDFFLGNASAETESVAYFAPFIQYSFAVYFLNCKEINIE